MTKRIPMMRKKYGQCFPLVTTYSLSATHSAYMSTANAIIESE